MALNVNRNVTDQFYRYKMPRIIAKVEGRGNGIKTVIVNMSEVAKSLDRPPTYPTKYFGCELGAQTTMDGKNDRFVVNGSHDPQKLQDMLDGFIKKFVLCPECDNPETSLVISAKAGTIGQRCIACGYQGPIDMRHRLTTYILKHPPGSEISGSTPSKKEKRNKGKKEKSGKQNGDADRDSPTGCNSPPPQEDGQIEVPAKVTNDGFDDDWSVDTSKQAVARRMEDLTDGAKGLALTDDLEKTQQERVNMFYSYVKNKRDNGQMVGSDKDFLAEAERLEVREKAPLVLVELLFNENMISQIKEYRLHFLRMVHENKKAQKNLLGAFEILVGTVHPDVLLPKIPHILKALYDADFVEEDVLLAWGKKPSKKFVSKEISQQIHEKAAPFIKWLEEADEESSEEEEEEESVQVVYSSHSGDSLKIESVPQKNDVPPPPQLEEDDIDIDDI
ncbi:eukaryotic translation initiation factor 5-like [Saccoglossus kowalevskii]|uniref:Eukaryotic translation initiation factor 5 n=1 Tax=Saccoglossus kowalevskii TaxID=10224 RepID=A0ABM0GM56_SACKO|nr:PREDICTED: eukaryotic translation initiation factor 5-like isoform X1 [Saccoglossus kowalevskii]XP_006814262.1 PREDICTED: eukaryotic translation initiation factor 5-like isoform X2 [Saccoglossus kowalevskii]XP_006814263.1 PREDICTED: eukaryotic translation initiation factor 5-like isoform X3 [Saccoglossus kowalevskii]